MSPAVRHLACAVCRNRKVKCDGGRPSCKRCQKAGEDCVYSTTTSASRAELQGTIRRLLERIEQTEACQVAFMTQNPSLFNGPPSVPFPGDMNQLETAPILEQNTQTGSGIPSSFIPNHRSSSSMGVGSPASVGGESIFSTDSRHFFSYTGTPDTGTSIAGASSTSTKATSTAQEPTILPFPTNINTNANTNPAAATQSMAKATLPSDGSRLPSDASRLPSLQDVQHWARHGPSQPSRQENGAGDASLSDGDVGELLDEFAALSTTTVRAQREIMGVAETAAMYLQYFRREGAESHDRESSVRLLETLEQRLREISDVASNQVIAQARNSRTNLKAHEAYRNRMMELEAELGPLDEALEAFFRTGYDLGKPLAGQID